MPFLADYHTHTVFSPDAEPYGFQDLFNAADKAGLNELCVTDHCDMGDDRLFPAEERRKSFEEARAGYNGSTKFLLGIELGDVLYNLKRADTEVLGYDFILGSLHMMRGEKDFYFLEYTSEEHCRRVLRQYLSELREMAEWGGFDVLGHIDYPLRQMRKSGFNLRFLPEYEEEVREIFSVFAEKGLGIEVNLRAAPVLDGILPLFKECGGGIVTIGSDAHCAADVGRGILTGIEMVRAAGFEYIAAFEKRKVRHEKI
jgi:histidinol-phosphatase (PHP family)